ncbi:MAG TPA: tetratricopeptide repeat protein [Planctomycetota bacterium]|nr:tetratricopeptide repeat protein [Planctomycetota bacterium]
MAQFDNGDNDSPEDRLAGEAEELMRQKRFNDAASRYGDLRRFSPTDLWASLGHASALECAGQMDDAVRVLEETAHRYRRSASLHRFRHLFFVRREDIGSAQLSQAALESEVVEEGPEDQLADLYFNQGRYHEALAELERLIRSDVIEEDELRASVLARTGACLRQHGEHERARERLLEALAIDPQHHWTLSELAEVERALGNIPNARRRYAEALAANPDDHWCRGHLAQMEWEQGEIERAIALYEEILAANPRAAWAKVELAQVVADRDPARSGELCRAALDDDPAYPWAHAQLGNLARRDNELDQARAHYLRALQASPNSPWVLHELADICRSLGRSQEGYAHLEHARGIDPYDATTYGYFADLLRHEGKNAQAVQHLEKAVELDDAYAWAWRELAELRALAGRQDDAEQAYRKAVDLEPLEAINDGLKAFLLRCAGRRDAATPWLERAVERQPDYLWAWREQIELHLARGRAAEAETCARLALTHVPDSAPVMGLLAEALRRQGRRDEARQQAQAALEHLPEAPQLWALMAELALESDQPVEARAAAARAAQADANPEWQALHAQVLVATGQPGEARPIVDRLLAARQPSASAYELGAVLAERAGDLATAGDLLDRGLAQHVNEPRLTVRRARLGLHRREADATARLVPLFELDAPAPWREIAQTFAAAEQPVPARRAAYLHLAHCPAHERARAWLALAELELTLGNPDESEQALARALALEPDAMPGRILAAVLADQRGELASAIQHLEHIDRQLHAGEPTPGDARHGESALLLRQLAVLYERHDRHDAAQRCWARIQALRPDDIATNADHASFLLRRGRDGDAAPLMAKALAAATPEPLVPEVQRLLRELALSAADRAGSRAAIDRLLPHLALLAPANRLLLAQLALADGDVALASAQVAAAQAKDPSDRAAALLACRCAIAAGDLAVAARLAQALVAASPAHEEAATLAAEVAALGGGYAEAIAILQRPSLPDRPNQERGLMLAALKLEEHGAEHALAALGRLGGADRQVPLVRLFAAAWPGTWIDAEVGAAARPRDVLSVPPFANLCRRLAQALARADRRDLAVALALRAADALEERDRRAARRLRRHAALWLAALGERKAALTQAMQARAPWTLLRVLIAR